MAVYVISTIKPQNNGNFPIAEANDIAGGLWSAKNSADLLSIPASKLKPGMLCWLEDEEVYKQYKRGYWVNANLGSGSTAEGNANIWIGPTPPEDTSLIWIDTTDDDLEYTENDNVIKSYEAAIKSLNEKWDGINYALTRKFDAGSFPARNETTGQWDPNWEPDGTIATIQIRKGKKFNLPILKDGELGYCTDTQELYIGFGGRNVRLTGSGTEDPEEPGGDTVGNYVEITTEQTETPYRLRVNELGELVIWKASIDSNAPTADQQGAASYVAKDGDASRRLVINQIYGGGTSDTTVGKQWPVSHSFVEIYNAGEIDAPLTGLRLYYKAKTGNWQSLALKGVLKPRHSFLVRGAQHPPKVVKSDITIRVKIDKYDQEWPGMKFSDQGFTVLLRAGGADAMVGSNTNYAYSENVEYHNNLPGFIDMLAASGAGDGQSVDSFMGATRQCMDINHGVRRVSPANLNGKISDNDNNYTDTMVVDYRTDDIKIYGPRSTEDGPWDRFYDKIELNPSIPNLVNIMFGIDGNTERTFSWQSAITEEGVIRWRKLGEVDWNEKDTVKELILHEDVDCTLHKVKIDGLETGATYEYQCGEEGKWTDIRTFKVNKLTETTDRMKVLWTSDQQGFTHEEYKAWDVSYRNLLRFHNGDWDASLNTGDISQNATFSYEWRYYHKYSGKSTRNMCHMACIGNNDMAGSAKDRSTTFPYYLYADGEIEGKQIPINQRVNNPNYFANSSHSFDVGFAHFVCLNSMCDLENLYGDFITTGEQFLQKECEWLDYDLTEARKNPNIRWVIIYMHLSPFTVLRSDLAMQKVQKFIPFFEKHRVQLVLCGHNHSYSRSKPLYTHFDGLTAKYSATNPFGYDVNGNGMRLVGDTWQRIVEKSMKGITIGDYVIPPETEVNMNGDLENGTYYVMCPATGYKLTGKSNILTVDGYDPANPTVPNRTSRPWWCQKTSTDDVDGYLGDHPGAPAYLTLDIGYNDIKLDAYKITNVVVKDPKNSSVDIVKEYLPWNEISNQDPTQGEVDNGGQRVEKFDSATINWRAWGAIPGGPTF